MQHSKWEGWILTESPPKSATPGVLHKAPQTGGPGPLHKGLVLDSVPSGFGLSESVGWGIGLGSVIDSDIGSSMDSGMNSGMDSDMNPGMGSDINSGMDLGMDMDSVIVLDSGLGMNSSMGMLPLHNLAGRGTASSSMPGGGA